MRGRAGDSDTFHARNANTHAWRGSTADEERLQPFGTVSSTEPSGSRRVTAPAVTSDGAGVPGIATARAPNAPAQAKVIRKAHSHAELEMLQRPRPPPLPPPPPRPRPTRAARSWLKFSIDGESSTITAEKHKIVHQLGVQMRDLRILDPKLANTYPSGLLCREQALVVNLEHIKCIVTTTFVLVLNADEENVASFVEELRKRLSTLRANTSFPVLAEAERFRQQRLQRRNEVMPAGATADEMPFELRVLEICEHMQKQTTDLEGAAQLAVDSLTTVVSAANLERERRIKNRLNRLKTKVETIKEVLEKYLDNDSDMRDMNLTAKQLEREEREAKEVENRERELREARQRAEQRERMDRMEDELRTLRFLHQSEGGGPTRSQSAEAAISEQGSLPRGVSDPSPPTPGASPLDAASPGRSPFRHVAQAGYSRSSSSSSSSSSSDSDSDIDDRGVAQVEMLLEAYFMMIDNTWNRLTSLMEFIDDAEDYINFELDSHRNQLIQVELMLTMATLSVALVGVVTGIFGMNLKNGSEGSNSIFILVTALTVAGSVLVFGVIACMLRRQRVLLRG